MLSWKKLEAGEYESIDGRFYVTKNWDRIYGDHWTLKDTTKADYYDGLHHENSLKDCKHIAEWILEQEKGEKSGKKVKEIKT